MLEKITSILIYGGISKEEYYYLREKISCENRKISIVFSSVALVLIGIMTILSTIRHEFHSSQTVYIIGTVTSLCILVIALLGARYKICTSISVYIAEIFFLLYGYIIGISTRVNHQTVTFMVMLILLPLIFVDRPIVTSFILIVYIASFAVAAYYVKDPEIKYVDIIDALIFGLLALASGTVIICIKIKGYSLERKLQIMSETDQLTGLNNRNCYESRLESYPDRCTKSICCIYIDVNGLHQMNNKYGHIAGDEMLKRTANMIIKTFGHSNTYRIGGDEYVAFVIDKDKDEINNNIKLLIGHIEKLGYHIAVGFEYQVKDNINMLKLVKYAEANMYDDKSQYYKKNGLAR